MPHTVPTSRETIDLPSPTTSMKKSSKALELVDVCQVLVFAPPSFVVVGPVSAVVPVVLVASSCPLKKILATMLEVGLVTENVITAFAVD